MVPVTDQEIQKLLNEAGLNAQIDAKSNQVTANISSEGKEYPLFCRKLADGELIQLIAFVPVTIEQKGLIELSRFLHMANKELDMPGFCVDEQSETVFYRVVIPTLGKKIDPTVLATYVKTIQNVCDTFGTIVIALAIGAMTMDEIMAMSKKKS